MHINPNLQIKNKKRLILQHKNILCILSWKSRKSLYFRNHIDLTIYETFDFYIELR